MPGMPFFPAAAQSVGALPAKQHLVQFPGKGDAVIDVKSDSLVEHGCISRFRNHDHIGFDPFDPSPSLLPEIERNQIACVAPIPVDVKFPDEVFHVSPEIFTQFRQVEIEFRNMPAAGEYPPVFIPTDEVGVFCNQLCGRPAMVIDQIEQNPQAEGMGTSDEGEQIVVAAIFRINPEVISDPVRIPGIVQK